MTDLGNAASFSVAPEGKFSVQGTPHSLVVGGTSTSVIAQPICAVCRQPLSSSPMEFRTAHDGCLRCPECHADFVVWKTTAPAILRCLNCLHRWEGVP